MAVPPLPPPPTTAQGPPLFRRVLVANRGEIARRIFRAARGLGVETVAVFADDDRHAPFVAEADVAVPLGRGPVADTYLDIDAVVEAACRAGADALHPGYGFSSEDPRLAEACAAAGIAWVGPPASAMAAMGHKAQAKALVAAAGVPVLESAVVGRGAVGANGAGDDGTGGDDGGLGALGERVGYPLLVKASAGGGGRGMRLVEAPGELATSVAAARREAASSFGNDEVFLERYVRSPRHVEVQVLADQAGAVVHLYDRECSIQRRHQKVIEEAPAVLVAKGTRRTMWEAALGAARAVGYQGVGTVEFVVEGERCFFLEMNTRLQVEHGVTELVTGLDLVQLQLLVAAGRPLPFAQHQVSVTGHAVEARLCAERAREGYRPTPGRVWHARWPSGAGVRCDAAVETGSVVSPRYDSLLAKILASGSDRPVAVSRLRAALAQLELDGVETNRDLLSAALAAPDFAAGRTTTDFLDRHLEVVSARVPVPVRRRHAAAAALFLEHLRSSAAVVPGIPPSWRNVGAAGHRDRFDDQGEPVEVTLVRWRGSLEIEVAGIGDRVGAALGPAGAGGGAGAAPAAGAGGGAGAGSTAGAAPAAGPTAGPTAGDGDAPGPADSAAAAADDDESGAAGSPWVARQVHSTVQLDSRGRAGSDPGSDPYPDPYSDSGSGAPGTRSGIVDVEVDGVLARHRVRAHAGSVAVSSWAGQTELALFEEDESPEVVGAAGECRAPLPGSVTRVLVVPGQAVADGADLVVLEAMKMEHTLRAAGPGVVTGVEVAPGQQVDVGQVLVVLEAAG